ncbi:MAG: hypothetical protein M9920_03260 [Verrucomicrobiae bacterium]|nr:hypothetical protein [Verrucomicrobiae bacterium]
MIEFEQFKELIAEIQSQGYDAATASRYAARIGDRPGYDLQGNIVVRDENDRILARLRPLKFYED